MTESKTVAMRDVHGRFLPGISGNPRGRQPGMVCRPRPIPPSEVARAQAYLSEEASAIVGKLIEAASAGDRRVLLALLDRVVPPAKERMTPVRLPKIRSAEDAMEAHDLLVEAVAAGELTLGEAERLTRLIEAGLKASETAALAERLASLEEAIRAKLPDAATA
jgi:hypothetical protein